MTKNQMTGFVLDDVQLFFNTAGLKPRKVICQEKVTSVVDVNTHRVESGEVNSANSIHHAAVKIVTAARRTQPLNCIRDCTVLDIFHGVYPLCYLAYTSSVARDVGFDTFSTRKFE